MITTCAKDMLRHVYANTLTCSRANVLCEFKELMKAIPGRSPWLQRALVKSSALYREQGSIWETDFVRHKVKNTCPNSLGQIQQLFLSHTLNWHGSLEHVENTWLLWSIVQSPSHIFSKGFFKKHFKYSNPYSPQVNTTCENSVSGNKFEQQRDHCALQVKHADNPQTFKPLKKKLNNFYESCTFFLVRTHHTFMRLWIPGLYALTTLPGERHGPLLD